MGVAAIAFLGIACGDAFSSSESAIVYGAVSVGRGALE